MSDNQACLNWMTYGRMFAEGTTRWAGCRRLAKQGICNHEPVVPPQFAEEKVFYESKRLEIGKMIRELCKWKEVNGKK